MKIKPQQHKIIHEIEKDGEIYSTDIPLSYMDTETEKEVIVITKSVHIPEYKTKEPVLPFDEIFSPDMLFFNKDEEPYDIASVLYRDGDKYFYRPEGDIEFEPVRFAFSHVIKKNMEYQSERNYDLRISCIGGRTVRPTMVLGEIYSPIGTPLESIAELPWYVDSVTQDGALLRLEVREWMSQPRFNPNYPDTYIMQADFYPQQGIPSTEFPEVFVTIIVG